MRLALPLCAVRDAEDRLVAQRACVEPTTSLRLGRKLVVDEGHASVLLGATLDEVEPLPTEYATTLGEPNRAKTRLIDLLDPPAHSASGRATAGKGGDLTVCVQPVGVHLTRAGLRRGSLCGHFNLLLPFGGEASGQQKPLVSQPRN